MGNFLVGGSGGGFIVPAEAPIPFANQAALDAWCTANKDQLIQNLTILQYIDGVSKWVLWTGDTNPVVYSFAEFINADPIIQGETGAAGATGNSYFFASVTARDNFFSITENLSLLETDLPIMINVDGKLFPAYWSGATNPPSYNPNLWLSPDLVTSGGRVVFGAQGGAYIASGLLALTYNNPATDTIDVALLATHDGSGSLPLEYPKVGVNTPVVAASVDTDTNASYLVTGISPFNSVVDTYRIKPASAGLLRIVRFLGDSIADPVIGDNVFEITSGQIGTTVELMIPNPIYSSAGTQLTISFTGVSLKGGVQVSGIYTGQTAPYLEVDFRSFTPTRVLTGDDTTAILDPSADRNYVTDAQLVVIGNTSGTNTGDENAQRIGNIVSGAVSVNPPDDADNFSFSDTDTGNILRRISYLNLKLNLRTYFNQFYQATLGNASLGYLMGAGADKNTPINADLVPYLDSTASNTQVKITWANLKAWLFGSPALTGIPTVPTAALNTNTTQAASTAFVVAQNSNKVLMQSNVANPAGSTSVGGMMMGIAFTRTPAVTGSVHITVTGNIVNSATDGAAAVQIRTGTGPPPANGAALTGTAHGSLVQSINDGNVQSTKPFSLTAVVTGLTLGVPFWIDVSLSASAGISTIGNVTIAGMEL